MATKRQFYIGFAQCGCPIVACVANEAGTAGAQGPAGIVTPNEHIATLVSDMILQGYAVERRERIPEDFMSPCPHITRDTKLSEDTDE